MKIEHICFDADDTLYPPSQAFTDAKRVKHRARLIQLLKQKGDKQATELVETLMHSRWPGIKFDEISVDDYNFLVDNHAEGGNSRLYQKLGVDHKWVERDVFYTDRDVVKYEPAVIEALKEIRIMGFELSVFTNTSYGSAANVLRSMGLTPEMQADIFAIGSNTNHFADECIGETRESLESALRQGTISQEDFDYMAAQYDAKMDFLRNGVNILSAEDSGSYKKPKHGGFERILHCTHIPPERILYVGDSIEKDLKPAKELGFSTCHVSWTEPAGESYVDIAIGKLMELPGKLK